MMVFIQNKYIYIYIMVLVSTKKKFIFIKPYFVNARHIETQLQKYCSSSNDIIGSMNSYLSNRGDKNVEILRMSRSIFPWYCHVHLPLNVLFPKINNFYKKNITDNYLKISVIKNPYELLIDFFWFYTDHNSKFYTKNGDIKKKEIINIKKNTNIGFYANKEFNKNKWGNITDMFNNWITSGMLLGEQMSKWEYLNELFYYDNKKSKENKIDFFININDNPQQSLNNLCNNLNIGPITFKKSSKKNPIIWNNKKFSDYFSKESVAFIEKNFYFTLKQGNYTYDPNCVYSQL